MASLKIPLYSLQFIFNKFLCEFDFEGLLLSNLVEKKKSYCKKKVEGAAEFLRCPFSKEIYSCVVTRLLINICTYIYIYMTDITDYI